MLRTEINDALAQAIKVADERRAKTLRLVNCAIKDRDLAARSRGQEDGVSDDDIRLILRQMIKQREESAVTFDETGRVELAEQERDEMDIIREFLPRRLESVEVRDACKKVVDELGATCIRDIGRTMTTLKQRYPGQMDFCEASSVVKEMLS